MTRGPFRMSLILLLVATSLVAGCATVGNETLLNEDAASIAEKVSKGQSKDEVRATLGDPSKIRDHETGERWYYLLSESKPTVRGLFGGVLLGPSFNTTKEKNKNLTVRFDKEGRVLNLYFSENERYY